MLGARRVGLTVRQLALSAPSHLHAPPQPFISELSAPCGCCCMPRPGGATIAAAGQRALSTFAELSLQPPLLAALEELELSDPTEIQRAAVPPILAGQDVLIASETGSGKTLAYLLPMVHVLKQEEQASRRRGRAAGARLQRPRAIVLVPSREVGRQVLRTVKSLAYHAKLASVSLCDQATPSKRVAAVSKRPVDVLVSTPGRLLEMLQSRSHSPNERGHGPKGQKQRSVARGRESKAEPALHLSDLRFVVFDEADVLFDDEFGPVLLPVLRRLLRKRDKWESSSLPAQLQCVLAGASWPVVVQSDHERHRAPQSSSSRKQGRGSPLLRELLRNELSHAVRVQSAGLHRLPKGLDLSFRDVAKGQSKPDALLDTLRHLSPGSAAMVFTNTTKAAVFVTAMLREEAAQEAVKGGRLGLLEIWALHGAMGPAERQMEFALFTEEAQTNSHAMGAFDYESEHLPSDEKIRVLVSTDVGSRGLDIDGVQLVVMFDCPRNPTDFLHRAGRTARAGAAGKATVLYHQHGQEGQLVSSLKQAYKLRQPIEGLVGWDHSHRSSVGDRIQA